MSVSVILILLQCCGRDNYPFLFVHIDLLFSQFSIFVHIHFQGVFIFVRCVRSSLNSFTKTDIYRCVFVKKRNSVNGT